MCSDQLSASNTYVHLLKPQLAHTQRVRRMGERHSHNPILLVTRVQSFAPYRPISKSTCRNTPGEAVDEVLVSSTVAVWRRQLSRQQAAFVLWHSCLWPHCAPCTLERCAAAIVVGRREGRFMTRTARPGTAVAFDGTSTQSSSSCRRSLCRQP